MTPVRILAIETASQLCSVSVLEGNNVRSALSLSLPRAHSERLPILLRDAPSLAGLRSDEITVVAVSSGPGSYTGLRIGVSAAKGFAYAVGAHLVGVDSLYVRARAAAAFLPEGSIVAAVLPSRRHELYGAVYLVQAAGTLAPIAVGQAVADSDFFALLPESASPALVVGEGAVRLMVSDPPPIGSPRVIPGPVPGFDASWVGRVALERFEAGQTEELASFEPHYLKPFFATVPAPAYGGLRNSAG